MSNKIYQKSIYIILISISLIKSAYSFCSLENCPPQRGVCYGNQCVCQNNYITTNIGNNNGVFCNYRLKSKMMAFILEFLFPFGVGHFYSGNIILGVIKLALWILMICMFCSILCCIVGKVINACSIIVFLIILLSVLGLVIMEIFDLISYGLGIYKDGKGFEMY